MNKDDMLKAMFAKQGALETALGYDFANMSEEERSEYVRLMSLMVSDELHEMLHEIPFFKPWKRYSNKEADNTVAWQKARCEATDALFFFLAVCLGLGLTAEELFEMYEKKLDENYKRQQRTSEYKRDVD